MRRFKYISVLVPRRSYFLRVTQAILFSLPLVCCWYVLQAAVSGLLPPTFEPDLQHFRRDRNLKNYLDNIQLLIEPSAPACDDKLLALVTSSPSRVEQRNAIRANTLIFKWTTTTRATWGRRLTTFFVLGVDGYREEDLTVDTYVEAKLHSDMIVYQFRDHYQNLTLKTGLMMKWTLERCPKARFLLKTDDDVLVNPWLMERIVERSDDDLIGYRRAGRLHRAGASKWRVPAWLRRDDRLPRYLSGTGYLLNVKQIQNILAAAYKVPMINLEDVYFTYLVANLTLGLNLTHDRRLSPFKPWLPANCLYWQLASVHSLSPHEIKKWGSVLLKMGESFETDNMCSSFENFSEWLLY